MTQAGQILAACLLTLALAGCGEPDGGGAVDLQRALARNHWQDAAQALAPLTDARPGDEALARQRTAALLALGDGEGALAAIERFAAAKPKEGASAVWGYLRAEAEVRRGQPRRALQLLDADTTAESRRIRALAYNNLGERDAAEAELRAGLALEPANARLNADLALHLLASGEVGAAREYAERAAKAAPASLDSLIAQGRCAELAEQPTAAMAHFRQAFALYPDSLTARLGQARLSAQSGRIEEAQGLIAPLYAQGNRNPELVVLHARIAAMQGNWEPARKALQEIEGEIRSDPEAQLLYASALQRTGQPELARAILERTNRRYPEYMAAAGMLAEIHLAEGGADEALALIVPFLANPATPPELLALARKARNAGAAGAR